MELEGVAELKSRQPVRGARTLQERPGVDECFGERQVPWKCMAGRSWSALSQQWGVPEVESLQLQKSIAAMVREVGPRLGELHWKESMHRPGQGEQGATRGGNGHAGGSSSSEETERS